MLIFYSIPGTGPKCYLLRSEILRRDEESATAIIIPWRLNQAVNAVEVDKRILSVLD